MQNPDEAIEQYQLAKKDRERLERMRDAEIAELKDALGYDWDKYKASQMALRECMQMVVEQDAEIAKLVAALEPFGAIDLVESRLPAEFAMLILRARAAIAKVRKP